ncbi:thyrotropin-releasing hormone receptor-like, partial [Aplysia californica]|uniref:Thyrotropin-releasing hormone receptor n=1 Tax=Aplysia californica TaxID=6500 RepID=A0ABM0K1F9_APLCA
MTSERPPWSGKSVKNPDTNTLLPPETTDHHDVRQELLNWTTHSISNLNVNESSGGGSSSSSSSDVPPPAPSAMYYSSLFAAVAVTLSAVIFTFGILGNALVVLVIVRTRSMHTTTNCYLLSLAVADLLVLISATLPAIPEPFYRVDEWPYGRVMCSLLIFLQYLGIDCSALSITAFTIERYIAICHPIRAQTLCTLTRAKRIVGGLWVFTVLYCTPWLGLT